MREREYKDDRQQRIYDTYLSLEFPDAVAFLNGYRGHECDYPRTSTQQAAYMAGLDRYRDRRNWQKQQIARQSRIKLK